MSPIPPLTAAEPRRQDSPARVLDAAQQFEALLLHQILSAARESAGPKESSSDCAMDYAEQQFAEVMARNGGLGLAALIAKGLQRDI
jgi:Rod binding domain-containing protein